MTDTTTEAVERLMKDVTPGPWASANNDGYNSINRVFGWLRGHHAIAEVIGDSAEAEANAAFIAAARDLVPALLSERDALKAQLAARRKRNPVTNADSCQPISIRYTNWRGETATRTIIPRNLWFGSTDWHPEPQWLMTATDVEKCADRDFALSGFAQPTRTYEDGVRDAARLAKLDALMPEVIAALDASMFNISLTDDLRAIIKEKSHE